MPLAINRQPLSTGADGAAGVSGTAGAAPGGPGADGTAGGIGRSAFFRPGAETFNGDDGNDSISLFARTFGGSGGRGGGGGWGAQPSSTVIENRSPTLYERIQTYTAAGDGGDGGDGGRGGAATTIYSDLVMNLAGGSDTVWIRADASGGYGNFGGAAGLGANGAGNSFSETLQGPVSNPEASVLRTVTNGAPAAVPGVAGDGGAGGNATAAIRGLDITAAAVTVSLQAFAYGRPGYDGGNSTSGGVGTNGAPGADGGTGGRGGSARAEVSGLDVTTTGRLDLTLDIRAEGGDGGNGTTGGAASYGLNSNSRTDTLGTVSVTTHTYAAHGKGGDGGAGGLAQARFLDSSILGGAANDSVRVFMQAEGGAGGKGGAGVAAIASSSTTNGGSTTVTNGTPASAAGLDGRNGHGRIIIENVALDLGAGNDSLLFDLRPVTWARVIFSGNSLIGGEGNDTLTLGASANGPAAFVDLIAGTLRLGSGTVANTLSGFERFVGTWRNDRFLDGAGNQTYDGNGGADRFDFRPGHGQDVVQGFGPDDVVRLLGFGRTFNSFEKVLAATADVAGGAMVDTGGGNSVFLQGVAKSALTADMFGFA